jgi:hypothetical protein
MKKDKDYELLHESVPHRAWRDTKNEFKHPGWVFLIAFIIAFGLDYLLMRYAIGPWLVHIVK